MAEAYLTRMQYAGRVGVELSEAPTDFELRLASDRLDGMGPWKGLEAEQDQPRRWPRVLSSWFPDSEPETPGAILDAVCLLAKAEADGEDDTPVKSESMLDYSVTFATAQVSRTQKRVAELIRTYQVRNGRIL